MMQQASWRQCRLFRWFTPALVAVAAITAGGAQAQSSTTTSSGNVTPSGSAYGFGNTSGNDYSWLPYTRRGYVGLSVGRADYSTSCGFAGYSCEKPNASFHLFTGGMFSDYFGVEVGYLHMGNADRAGGSTRAQGLNLSLIGTVPVHQSINLYGKVGATYGRTRVSSAVGSGAPVGGSESGWGPSAALGVGYNFDRNWTLSLERSRDSFHFEGLGRAHVDSTNLVASYRF